MIIIEEGDNRNNPECGSLKNETKIENDNNIIAYHIRPYALNFIRALQPFFELIVFSRIPVTHLIQIIDHIEKLLNKPT